MNNNNSKGVSYTTGFFMLIGLALLGIVAASVIGAAILLSATGGNIQAMEKAAMDPANAGMLRAIQAISVLIGMFLPTLIVASILNRKPFRLLGYQHHIQLRQLGLVVLIVFCSLFIAGAFGYLNKIIPLSPGLKARFDRLENSYAEQVEVMLSLKSFGGYVLSMLLMAFLPALCEETLFRGGLQNFLGRATRSPWLAILVVSILFSLVHFSFYGFLPRLFLGVVLGLTYYLTGNLWLSITAHFLNNALAITQAYMYMRQGKSIKDTMNGDLPTYYWGFLAIPFLIMLFRALKKTAGPGHLESTSNRGENS